MSDTKKLIIAAIVVVILVVGLFLNKNGMLSTAPKFNKSNGPTPIVSPTEQNVITIENSAYNPANLVVKVGDKVTWKNSDTMQHTATFDSLPIDTGTLNPNESATISFPTAGTFTYHCTFHPGMTGTIIVE